MKYLLLIQKSEAKWRALDDAGRAAVMARYAAYGKEVVSSGIVRAGAMLEPTDAATTVRVREGKRLVVDGPFAETEEQIAGLMIIEVKDLDAALDVAARHPDAEWASIEIRPIVPWEEPPG